jgi:enterochelin esterase family protein
MSSSVLRQALIMLCLSLIAVAQPQPPFATASDDASPRIAQLRDAVREKRVGAVNSFWEEVGNTGTPLIEPIVDQAQYSWVTFLWQAKENTANVAIIDGVAGGIGEYDPSKNLMTWISGTDVWYRTYKVRNDAAFTYWISPNDSLERLGTASRRSQPQADPFNSRRSGPQSYVELKDVVSASVPEGPKGHSEITKLVSGLMKNERSVMIYTPAGYDSDGTTTYPLLVMLDGGAYVSLADMRPILDELMAKKQIPPTVAIFVFPAMPENRTAEMSCNDTFADFLAEELVPWIRGKYHVSTVPGDTIIGGSSLSALEAMFTAWRHSEIFGKVLSLSGSHWWTPQGDLEPSWLIRQLASSPRVPVRISMSVGLMEVHDQLDTNRHLRDVLIAKGYWLRYSEFNGNHGYVSWKSDLPQRLTDLFQP